MSDSQIETKFSDIPYDIIKNIKNHVTIFKDNEEEYIFYVISKKGRTKIYINTFSIKIHIILFLK